MIVLKADKELNLTFQKLIKMMDVPVEWNGIVFCDWGLSDSAGERAVTFFQL